MARSAGRSNLRCSFSRSVAVKAFVIGFGVFLFGTLLEAWLISHNVHGLSAVADNLAIAVVVGIGVSLYERRREREIERQLETIRLMNHHVRNALQALYASFPNVDANEQGSAIIVESVRRIEWALREVLPGTQGHSYFDGPPKAELPKAGTEKPAL